MGLKTENNCDVLGAYAPVSCLSLVRTVLVTVNKYDLETCQINIKMNITAFLKETLNDDLHMKSSEVIQCEERKIKSL